MKSSRFLSIFLLCSTLFNTQITTAMDGSEQQSQSVQNIPETPVSEELVLPETPPIDEQIETSSEIPVPQETEELASPEASQIDQQVENTPSETLLGQEVIEEEYHESEAESEMSAIQFDEFPASDDEAPKRSILLSLLSSFIRGASHIVGNVLAEGLETMRIMAIQEAAQWGKTYIKDNLVTLAITAAPHIITATKKVYRTSYDFSDRHPSLSLFTRSTLPTLLGAGATYLAVKSDLVPTWGKALAIGGGACAGALQLQTPLQVLRGKRFFMQQDRQDSPSFDEIFRSQPRVISKMVDVFRDQNLYYGFYYETNGTISVYGENSSAEDKRNIIRAIARETNIPVFFITKEDFENSPENALNTVLKIVQKADAAAFAYNTTCSFVCFEDFRELFNEHEEIRNLISNIRLGHPLYSLHRIIFWGLNQQESHDERLSDQFFSFKLHITQSSEGHEAAPSLKVIPQHIPSFKPINFREDKKNELPCYEASDITLKDITGGYPEAIKVIVHELTTQTPGQGADGILLWGKPGTGKTRLARALAGTFNVPFFNVKISRVLQEGTNAGNFINALFENAHKKAISDKSKYAIIFFDECDSLLQPLSKITDPTIRSANVALRSQLSGFTQDKKVICIAAANSSPNKLDEALLRPGRFGTHIHFKLPNTRARQEVLTYYLSEIEDRAEAQRIGKTFAYDTKGFSQADLEQLVKDSRRWAEAFGTSIEEQLPTILFNMQKSKSRVTKDRSPDEAYGYSSSEDEGDILGTGKEEVE